jgi:maleate isomerase
MNWKAMDAIQALEYDTKKPVVTANQATLWKILRMAGVYEPIDGYGVLLRGH